MKCRNCGLPRNAHVESSGPTGPIWLCPNGSGDIYPETADAKIEIQYRAGDDCPWLVHWSHPTAGSGEAAAARPEEAFALAGKKIEALLQEKTADEIAIEKAIHER
jgi:hypothetical protein